MREGRGAQAVSLAQLGAGHQFFARRGLPEHLNASRLSRSAINILLRMSPYEHKTKT
jgi:hypothetical protein